MGSYSVAGSHEPGPTSIPYFEAGCQEALNLEVCAFGQHRSLSTRLSVSFTCGMAERLMVCCCGQRAVWCASEISCVTFDTQSVIRPRLHGPFHRSADLVRAFLWPIFSFPLETARK